MKLVNRRYGIWVMTSRRGIEDARIVREGRDGYQAPSQFERAIGVRYSKGHRPRFPNCKGGYCGFGHGGPPRGGVELLKGFFRPGPMPRYRVALCQGHEHWLARSSGYIILWAPAIKLRSVRGLARLVGSAVVGERVEEWVAEP